MQEASAAVKASWAADGAPVTGNALEKLRAEDDPVSETALPVETAQVGLLAALATTTMLFAGFTSAYLVRRSGADWQPVSLPGILWLNTGLLLSSSAAIEITRSRMHKGQTEAVKLWLGIAAVLGVGFLAGQILAWRQLVAQGVYLPTSAHSSFFYVLTGLHGLHLLGGVMALLYALGRVSWASPGPSTASVIRLSAIYWHFVDGLWLYLFVLLSVW